MVVVWLCIAFLIDFVFVYGVLHGCCLICIVFVWRLNGLCIVVHWCCLLFV